MASPIISEMKSSSLPAPDSPIQYGNSSRALGIFHWSIGLLLLFLAQTDFVHFSVAGLAIIIVGYFIVVVASPVAIVCGHLGRRKEQQQRPAALAGLFLGYTGLIWFPIVIPIIFWQSLKL